MLGEELPLHGNEVWTRARSAAETGFPDCHRRSAPRAIALAIANVNGADDAGLEGLYQLDAAVGDDFAGRRGDDIDMPETCPDQRQAE